MDTDTHSIKVKCRTDRDKKIRVFFFFCIFCYLDTQINWSKIITSVVDLCDPINSIVLKCQMKMGAKAIHPLLVEQMAYIIQVIRNSL